MEIINSNANSLSNFEVISHLQNVKVSKNKGLLATITYETLRYLEDTPCKLQTPESISSCLAELSKFNLNKNEKLMMINNPPSSALEIQLIVEDSEERLTEEQVEYLLQMMEEHFPFIKKDTENS